MLKNYSKIKTYKNGDKNYLNDERRIHRLDGPAIERSDGSKLWSINGNTHRNIDPSIEWSDGRKYWHFKDKPHRIGGSHYSEFGFWFIHAEDYDKQDYFNIVWDI